MKEEFPVRGNANPPQVNISNISSSKTPMWIWLLKLNKLQSSTGREVGETIPYDILDEWLGRDNLGCIKMDNNQ